MTAWLDKLNLAPQERRLVLVGLVILLLLLNYWLIWPYFGEWNKTETDLIKARQRLTTYMGEIAKRGEYDRKLTELQKSGGGTVLHEDQANRVQTTIYTQGSTHGVQINGVRPVIAPRLGGSQTNQFFDEVQMTVEVVAGEQELVNFLHSLGSGDSMIRVKDIVNLRLDPLQTRLQTTLTLAASFQKRAPAATPAAGTNRPSSTAIQAKGPPKSAVPATNKPAAKAAKK